MELALKIVAGLLGFIAGVVSYPYFDEYVLGLLAFIGSVAVGVLVYALVVNLAGRTTRL